MIKKTDSKISSTISKNAPDTLPLLVLPKVVLFPENTIPLASLNGLQENDLQSMQQGNVKIGIVTKISSESGKSPNSEQVYRFGTEAVVTGLLKLPNNELGALVKGTRIFEVKKITKQSDSYSGQVEFIKDRPFRRSDKFLAVVKSVKSLVLKLLKLNPSVGQEAIALLYATEDPILLCNIVTPHLSLSTKEKIGILSEFNVPRRLEKLFKHLNKEVELLKLSTKIQDEVKNDVHDNVRKSFLKEQLQAIKREIGELSGEVDELEELKQAVTDLKLPKEARQAVDQELERLQMMPPGSPEYMVSWTYIQWIKDLPWASEENKLPDLDLKRSSELLDNNHFGLDRVKDRILEYLAVVKHKGSVAGQILLLQGPPGVGKTSLGQSIAEAIERPFVRVSLGGVKDEAEIRGHRRTYIGSLPGKIIHAMKEAKVHNPVILLDEIDKAGSAEMMGDVSSALLELLDPEQNNKFTDHYLSLPYDLSSVLFIATANSLRSISPPLLDRMETIEISGYTDKEKVSIAQDHLIPKIKKKLMLNEQQLNFDPTTLSSIIHQYTREAGVRQLNRQLNKIGRKIVRGIVEKKASHKESISEKDLYEYLGVPKFFDEPRDSKLMPGVSIGLAYTSVGGDILYIESRQLPSFEGRPKLMLTGSLGKVMQESAQTVLSFLLSNAERYGINKDSMEKNAVHIHLPDGATPKDGPSAGVALLCAMTSLYTGKAISNSLAMTGEITLRGQVLPVGGIKEKLLAAHRYNKKDVIIPAKNWLDLEELPEDILQEMNLYPVYYMEEVLNIAKLLDTSNAEGAAKAIKFHKGSMNIPYPSADWDRARELYIN